MPRGLARLPMKSNKPGLVRQGDRFVPVLSKRRVRELQASIDRIKDNLTRGPMRDATIQTGQIILKEIQGNISTRFKRRTGRLRKSWQYRVVGNPLTGFQVKVFSTHPGARVQDQRKVTTIVPRKVRWLAIPVTPLARRAASPRNFPGRLYPMPSKKPGTLLLVRDMPGGVVRTQFVLKKRVKIRGRGYATDGLKTGAKKARSVMLRGLKLSIEKS